MKEKILLLDLEGVCINDWFEGRFLLPDNLEKIAKFARDEQTKEVCKLQFGLMSWAVQGSVDLSIFERTLREHIELLIDQSFDDDKLWTMRWWTSELFRTCGTHVELGELSGFYKKLDLLVKIAPVSESLAGREVILIDDHVPNVKVEFPDSNTMIRTVNIARL